MLFLSRVHFNPKTSNLRSTVERNAMMKKKCAPKSPKTLKVCQDRNYDCVYLGGQKINLGRTGTPEADAASVTTPVP